MNKRSIAVFCGSSSSVPRTHLDAATTLGQALARRGLGLVYGGNSIGLMRVLADATLAAGGEVVGVLPRFMMTPELAHDGLTELRVVENMHERKRLMAELASGFVVLPGGFGTLEEMIEVITWRQLGLHEKPIVLLDVAGYWQPLVSLVDHLIGQGYARLEHTKAYCLAGEVELALDLACGDATGSREKTELEHT